MRVLVTGAAGFIGSHVAERLAHDGHDVIGIDSFTDYYGREQKEANLREAQNVAAFTFVETDLLSDHLDPLLEGVDVVINEAATPGLLLSWSDFERYESCNVYAVHRLIKACQRAGIAKFVQASTSSVYGAVATGDEREATRPISPYGVTKLAAEHLLLAYHDMFRFPVAILRYFSIYGPRQRPDMAYRIFCENLLHGLPISVFGDGTQSRGNTYISDCVEATVRAIDGADPGMVLNVGGGREVALLDAIRILGEALDVDPKIDFLPSRPGDQQRTIADTSLARETLGWRPEVEPEEGLVRQAAWVRARS